MKPLKSLEEVVTLEDIDEYSGRWLVEKWKAFTSDVKARNAKQIYCGADIGAVLGATGDLDYSEAMTDNCPYGDTFCDKVGDTEVYIDVNSKGIVFK